MFDDVYIKLLCDTDNITSNYCMMQTAHISMIVCQWLILENVKNIHLVNVKNFLDDKLLIIMTHKQKLQKFEREYSHVKK